MRGIKAIILVVMTVLTVACCTTVKTVYVDRPKPLPLPHPDMPTLEIPDDITPELLMEDLIILSGAIEKMQVLVEIYERENTDLPAGYSSPKFSGKSLEELKQEYYRLLGILDQYQKNGTAPAGTTPTPAPAGDVPAK